MYREDWLILWLKIKKHSDALEQDSQQKTGKLCDQYFPFFDITCFERAGFDRIDFGQNVPGRIYFLTACLMDLQTGVCKYQGHVIAAVIFRYHFWQDWESFFSDGQT